MAMPPLLKRRSAEASLQPSADATELLARTRARRRLIGAAVLLVSGVIAFPLLFETQPRPVPVDIPMVIPSRESAGPLAPPPRPSRSGSGTIAEPAATEAATPASAPAASAAAAPASAGGPAPAVVAGAAAAAAAGVVASKVLPVERLPAPPAEKSAAKSEAKAPDKAASKPAPKPEAKQAARTEPKAEVKALATKPEPKAEAKPADTKSAGPAASPSARYVVQVGAYADEASAREARQKVERLGLKTYTQVVEVQGATRIRVRVGPFESTQEANKALATLKAGKLPGAVLTL